MYYIGCGAPHLELPTMKCHDSCNRSTRTRSGSYNVEAKLIGNGLERITDCGEDIASIHSDVGSRRSVQLELTTENVIGFILNLTESELINGWNGIDKEEKNKLSLNNNDVDKLLTFYINCYIEYKLPDFESNTDDHRYTLKSLEIIEEIKDLLQSVMDDNDITNNTEYITFKWFVDHFKEYLNQIDINEDVRT